METKSLRIPKIDFSSVLQGDPAGWDAVQEDMLRALETYGCFEVLYDRVSPDLKNELFCEVMPELFSLPTEIKKGNISPDMPYKGYLSKMPQFPYESMYVREGDAEGFTRLMWPNGNPYFCEIVTAYTNLLKELEQMIERMVFRSLNIEKFYESYAESLEYGVRLAEYGIPLDQESKIALKAHFDVDPVTIICQHQADGLEVQTKEGEWIHVVTSPNSFVVVIGLAFEAWSNGRLQAVYHRVRVLGNEKRYSAVFNSRPKDGYLIQAPKDLAWSNGRLQAVYHRVRVLGNEKRYSAVFNSRPKDGYLIQAPKDLVDETHPLLYKPYTLNDHIKFRISCGGGGTLKDFCGLTGE